MSRSFTFGMTGIVAALMVVGCQPDGGPKAGAGAAPKAPAAGAAGKPADPLEDMRTPWQPGGGAGFLRDWVVCGVFPNAPGAGATGSDRTATGKAGEGFYIDYLAAEGGEAAIRPAAGATVRRPDGTAARWTAYRSPKDEIDFRSVFAGQPCDNVVAYAFGTVRRDAPGKAYLALGSDDSVKVWLNGKLVHEKVVGRAVQADDDVVPVDLAAGENAVLLKVENGRSGWGFIFRVIREAQAAAVQKGEINPRIEAAPPGKPDAVVVATDVRTAVSVTETVTVAAVAAGGKVVAQAQAARGKAVELDSRDWPAGPYEVRLTTRTPDGRLTVRHLAWYKGDWRAHVQELLGEAAKLPARPVDAGQLRLKVLEAFVLDRWGGDPRKADASPGPQSWAPLHSVLMEHREVQAGEGSAIRAAGFLRLAWRDEIDDSPQYARAYLPPDYDAAKAWPLVVVLHGYNPSNPQYVRWWDADKRHNKIADAHNVIVVEPHGRGNTGYRGMGDADVMRAVAEAKARFRVDEDRVYLAGYSMGGGGTWHVGTRHVGAFAAIAPIYGGWDYRGWMDANDFAGQTAWGRFARERDSSFVQAECLLSTPVFVNHGDADELVDVKFSRHAVRMLQRWGYSIRYWEHPGKGHGALGCENEMLRWMQTHKLDRAPRRVRIRAAELGLAAAHWVRIERQENPTALMFAEAEAAGDNVIRLSTENVLAVRLTPPAALVDASRPVQVIWNGADAGQHKLQDGAIALATGKAGRLGKSPELPGLVRDATNTPFAYVVGTTSRDPLMRQFCRRVAERSADGWKNWQKVSPRCFNDTEIADEQMRSYSLILIGGPEENAVTKRLAKDIPLKTGPGGVEIGGKLFAARDAAVQMIYPHPLNAKRYVVMVAATSAAGMYQAQWLDDEADFVVSDGRMLAETPGEKLAVAMGNFDANWQLDERFVVRGDAAVRAKAVVRKVPRQTAAAAGDRLMVGDVLESTAMGSFLDMKRDLNWQAGPIRLGGKTYAGGIAVAVWHEPSRATYDLGGAGWKRLKGTLGIEIDKPQKLDEKGKKGTRVFFVVRGDGKELYRSPIFTWDAKPVEMNVDVTGVGRLELEVGNESTWFCAASSVDWADLRLER